MTPLVGVATRRIGPLGEAGDRPAGGVEGVEVAEGAEAGVGGRPDDHGRDVAALVGEDVAVVAVELGAPGDRAVHRPGSSVRGADGRSGTRRPCRCRRRAPAAGPAGRGGRWRRSTRSALTVDPSTTTPTTRPPRSASPSTCPTATVSPSTVGRRPSQRSLVGDAAGAHADRRRGGTGQRQLDRLGAEVEPRLPGLRPLGESRSRTCGRNPCACSNCMTPRRRQEPSGAGPGSRSTATTRWRRRASAAPRSGRPVRRRR